MPERPLLTASTSKPSSPTSAEWAALQTDPTQNDGRRLKGLRSRVAGRTAIGPTASAASIVSGYASYKNTDEDLPNNKNNNDTRGAPSTMASYGMFHRGHSQLQLKLRRLQPDLQARVRDWPAGFQFQQTMFLAVQDRGRRSPLFADRSFCSRSSPANFLSPRAGPVPSRLENFVFYISYI